MNIFIKKIVMNYEVFFSQNLGKQVLVTLTDLVIV
jgi:hypothetical protein